jgi:hypothetical protein
MPSVTYQHPDRTVTIDAVTVPPFTADDLLQFIRAAEDVRAVCGATLCRVQQQAGQPTQYDWRIEASGNRTWKQTFHLHETTSSHQFGPNQPASSQWSAQELRALRTLGTWTLAVRQAWEATQIVVTWP